jgi:phospholipase C
VKHPPSAVFAPDHARTGAGVPVLSDLNPFWGSAMDFSASGQPTNARDNFGTQINQTYATLPLSLAGTGVPALVRADRDPATDLADVQHDVPAIAARGKTPIPWGWFEEGYDREPTDPPGAPPGGTHFSYIPHHNGPQYFGYIANNPALSANMHGLADFFTALGGEKLPEAGGLFYVRGGYVNIAGLKPVDPDAAVQQDFRGDDDHPGYADAEISEALVARSINAIARSPYWSHSVIIITYDESTGNYDHVPPTIVENGPNDIPLSRGPRIPLIVISPFARAHAISHESGDQASVVRLVDTIFDLAPLADLPDELEARLLGEKTLGLKDLGPADDLTPGVGGLLSAFDDARLAGTAAALPPGYAEIPDAVVGALPHYGGKGCRAIGIVPEDVARGIANPVPADFNPRPGTDPSP